MSHFDGSIRLTTLRLRQNLSNQINNLVNKHTNATIQLFLLPSEPRPGLLSLTVEEGLKLLYLAGGHL